MAHRGANLEVEIKLRVLTPEDALRRLDAAGFAESRSRSFEANVLLDQQDVALRASRRILRLRQVAGETVLTYKGPPVEGRHKSREEIEVQVSDPDAMTAILDRLGFHPGYRYEKYRTEFRRTGEPGVATLDETPIGAFLELEGDPDWIDRTAVLLGFREQDYITESYAALYARYCVESGRRVDRGMVFPQPAQADT